MEYDETFVRSNNEVWTDAKIAEEIEDIGFETEVMKQSEIEDVQLRIYGLVARSTHAGIGIRMAHAVFADSKGTSKSQR